MCVLVCVLVYVLVCVLVYVLVCVLACVLVVCGLVRAYALRVRVCGTVTFA